MKKLFASFLAAFLLCFMVGQLRAAATTLTAQKMLRSGITPTAATLVDVSLGNQVYLLTDGVFLRLNNPAAATDLTMTVTDQFTNPQGYTNDLSVLVPRGGTRYVGPFIKSRWANGSGYMQMTYVGSTTTAIEVFRLPIGEPDSQTK